MPNWLKKAHLNNRYRWSNWEMLQESCLEEVSQFQGTLTTCFDLYIISSMISIHSGQIKIQERVEEHLSGKTSNSFYRTLSIFFESVYRYIFLNKCFPVTIRHTVFRGISYTTIPSARTPSLKFSVFYQSLVAQRFRISMFSKASKEFKSPSPI